MLHLLFLKSLKHDAIQFLLIFIMIFGDQVVSLLLIYIFVTFVDKFTQSTWVYLKKDRSELLSTFMSFFNEIKN